MIKSRTRGAVAAALVVSASLLITGCAASPSNEKVTISFMPVTTPNLNADLWAGVIDSFEEENPNIEVEYVDPSGGGEFISYVKTLNAAGNLPDIFFALSQDFAQLGIIQELPEDLLTPFNNYQDTAIDGGYYFVPAAVQPQSLLWYNKSLFEQAGISSTPTTMDELDDALSKLSSVTDVPMAITGEWTTGWQAGAFWSPLELSQSADWYAQRTAGDVTFAGSEWETVAEQFSSWAAEGKSGPSPLSTTFDQGQQQFIAGESGIYPMGVWFGATLANAETAFDVGVFPAPSPDGSSRLSVETSLQYSLSASTTQKDAALAFIKFATQDEDSIRAQLQADGLFSNAVEPVTYDLSGPISGVGDILASTDAVGTYQGQGSSVPIPGFSDFLNTQTQSLVLGDLSASQFITSLDDWWDQNS